MLAYVLHALCAMRACPSSSSLSLISIFIIVIIVIVTIVVTLIIVTIIIVVIIITVIIIITMQNYTSDASVSSEKTGTSSFSKLGQEDEHGKADFFGFPERPPFYCARGGMSSLPAALLEEAKALGATLRGGVRVASTQRLSSGAWLLRGVEGPAALHDTAEEEAAKQAPDALGEFDIVIVTDVSASMASWHRASAGLPESLACKVRKRTRVALFTALAPLKIETDAFAAASPTLWFAARTSSKPGLAESQACDCWSLVSTPKYAAAEIERVPMQAPRLKGTFA
eukprot:s507_g8.t1